MGQGSNAKCRDGSQKIRAGEKEGNTWWVADMDRALKTKILSSVPV